MPNKHRKKKILNKLLISGKLDKNENIQKARKILEEKIALDQEDIDFDYDPSKNGDFEKLDPSEDKPIKSKPPKKRKAPPTPQQNNETAPKAKKIKPSQPQMSSNPISKKSKKNKYFFMAHPEALQSKEKILADLDDSEKSKFVIDEEKLKLIKKKLKKKKPTDSETPGAKLDKKSKSDKNGKSKKPKLWSIEVCSASEDDEKEATKKPIKASKTKMPVINIDDIDKSFKIKKTTKTLEDGSRVQVVCPEFEQEDNDDDEDDEPEDVNGRDENGNGSESEQEEVEEVPTGEANSNGSVESSGKSNPLVEKLKASRFRFLNEMLYSQPSEKSFEYFKNDQDAFRAYHDGFQQQVTKWPLNPLDVIIDYIKKRPANLVVADFGCGEARLAQSVKNKVHSFDLAKTNDLVTVCDMRHVPLEAESCDIVVFCLSLMGTNVVEFLCEAHRVLKSKSVLKIAEVVSRIEDKGKFMKKIESMGFKIVNNKKDPNSEKGKNYFYFFDFVKTSNKVDKKPEIKLLPCIYKKR